jgi:hypothetical protein
MFVTFRVDPPEIRAATNVTDTEAAMVRNSGLSNGEVVSLLPALYNTLFRDSGYGMPLKSG